MKNILDSNWLKKIPTIVFFIIAVIVMAYFFPREKKYEYAYSIGKPWLYGLVTAPYNFNIKKSDSQISFEKDSVVQSTPVYYTQNDNTYDEIIKNIDQDVKRLQLGKSYTNYLSGKLKSLYNTGVISGANIDELNAKNIRTIRLIKKDTSTANARTLGNFYTPGQVYETIINDTPDWINVDDLKQINLIGLLIPNVEYDEKTTVNSQDESLRNISLFAGTVQAGQKIIDRGEIVTPKTYDILNSYTALMAKINDENNNINWSIVGYLFMIGLLIASLGFYLHLYRPEYYTDHKNVIFILAMSIIMPIIASFMGDMKMYTQFYLLPLAIPTILVRTFMDSRTALMVHYTSAIICALMLPLESMPMFIFIQLLVGYVCIISLKQLSERSQLIYCSFFIFVVSIVGYTSWILSIEGNFSIDTLYSRKDIYVYFFLNVVFVSFAYSLIYVLERVFGFISEVTMIELSNTNKKLLHELSEVAPGTFQHCMQVSSLVVAAANKIGANPVLARTGALYHDIGKMLNPIFFTENQPDGINPHKNLTYEDSAKIIIGHVTEGVKLAKKHNLPQQIIDFIETHHGLSMTGYFYTLAQNEQPDEEIDKAPFTYPGPNPFSKETALLMMADTIEAASRSLKENTKESITALVNKLIDKQVESGYFDDCPITFKEIKEAKEVFCERLISMRHARVAYPELNKKK